MEARLVLGLDSVRDLEPSDRPYAVRIGGSQVFLAGDLRLPETPIEQTEENPGSSVLRIPLVLRHLLLTSPRFRRYRLLALRRNREEVADLRAVEVAVDSEGWPTRISLPRLRLAPGDLVDLVVEVRERCRVTAALDCLDATPCVLDASA